MSKIKEIRGYAFKKLFLWIGWIIVQKEETGILYYDNVKTVTLEPTININCLVFGLTQKSVHKKLVKHIAKLDMKGEQTWL